MGQTGLRVNDAVVILGRTPAALDALLRGVPDTWARATEGEGTWSPCDVVGHLVHGERADWLPRARHILSGDPRPFTPFDREAQFSESAGSRWESFSASSTSCAAEAWPNCSR